ncbi:hypothetical protein GCM10027451_43880 [Geodermatophilus aquaeductus]|jgi:hypothetical protein|uniref:Uncharacterized protein n=1 Tax=Geodermatophilus aquaeductus TaxID=1564161 RepID=A0A521FPD2_9ACTN|nr:hypothetical protein [Geodermatophilus aquaeductus]SMO98053.1 hypothetical protein SAMN06273567_11269 [Geodermatophilus aquaeductus]
MSPSDPTPGDDRQRWEMSPEEKLIAQWEAQHDVAARGSRCDPLGLQHQLGRERLADRTRPPAPRATDATASRTAAEAAADAEQRPEPPTARRHPWRRFHHHASEH